MAEQSDTEAFWHMWRSAIAGRWTVDMFAMFHLGRPDVFPLGDLAVRKGLQELYKLKVLCFPWPHHQVAPVCYLLCG